MKQIFSILLVGCVLFSFVGCKSNGDQSEKPQQKIQMGSSFNDEVYVWESFMFPTNRTTGAQ